MGVCKRQVKICPECLAAYGMIRKGALKDGKLLEVGEDAENEERDRLVLAFNNKELSEEDFEALLAEADQRGVAFIRLSRRIGTMK